MSESMTPSEVIDLLQRFATGFRNIRPQIERMSEDELIELYQKATEITNVSWLVRCIILGVAHDKSVRGDGSVKSIAQAFGIGKRMAEIDIKVYNTFIRDNPDFEPTLPAAFYQIASRSEDPDGAIDLAMELRAQNPAYPSTAFGRDIRGAAPKEPAPAGVYALVRVSEGETIQTLRLVAENEGGGTTPLYGNISLYSINGIIYAEIK